jgi:hypothetical protein
LRGNQKLKAGALYIVLICPRYSQKQFKVPEGIDRMKTKLILAAAVCGVLLLSACGSGRQDVETASAFINSLNQGDVDGARQYTCEEEADGIIEGLATVGEDDRQTWDFQNVTCSAASGDVQCSYQIMQATEDNRTQTLDHTVIFKMVDGKVCGYEAQVDE